MSTPAEDAARATFETRYRAVLEDNVRLVREMDALKAELLLARKDHNEAEDDHERLQMRLDEVTRTLDAITPGPTVDPEQMAIEVASIIEDLRADLVNAARVTAELQAELESQKITALKVAGRVHEACAEATGDGDWCHCGQAMAEIDLAALVKEALRVG